MQVRAIEFQENFRLVTLEASRQQSVLNRGATVANEGASAALVSQRALNLDRPNPAEESEASRVVDEGVGRRPRSRERRPDRRGEQPAAPPTQDSAQPRGRSIDLLA